MILQHCGDEVSISVLFFRLVQEKGRNGETEILRMILGKAGDRTLATEEEEELIVKCMSEEFNAAKSPTDKDLDGEELVFGDCIKSDNEEEDAPAVAGVDSAAMLGQSPPEDKDGFKMARSKTLHSVTIQSIPEDNSVSAL